MAILDWNLSKGEHELVEKITKRAVAVASETGIQLDYLEMSMDITAAHNNGCRLKLGELAEADGFNFSHDVFGIRRHIDRETGELRDCFVPRFAA